MEARRAAATQGEVFLFNSGGAGCLRTWIVPDTHAAVLNDSKDCIAFILAISVPLSALLLAMLRSAYPLRPGLAAAGHYEVLGLVGDVGLLTGRGMESGRSDSGAKLAVPK